MRIMKLRRRKLKLKDKVKTKSQLVIIKGVLLNVFEENGLSRSKIQNIKVRIGQDYEFGKNNDALLHLNRNGDEIVLKKGMIVARAITEIFHEVGHEITIFGTFGLSKNRCNLLGEISAYNFQKRYTDIFCKRKGRVIKTRWNIGFFDALKTDCVHYISFLLKDIPLGKLIRKEYKNK